MTNAKTEKFEIKPGEEHLAKMPTDLEGLVSDIVEILDRLDSRFGQLQPIKTCLWHGEEEARLGWQLGYAEICIKPAFQVLVCDFNIPFYELFNYIQEDAFYPALQDLGTEAISAFYRDMLKLSILFGSLEGHRSYILEKLKNEGRYDQVMDEIRKASDRLRDSSV